MKTIEEKTSEKFVTFDGILSVRREGMGENDFRPAELRDVVLFAESCADERADSIIRSVESTIAEFGDQGIELVASILQESFHGKREIEY